MSTIASVETLEEGIELRGTGAWKKSVTVFKKIISLEPDNPDAHAHLARSYSLQRRHEMAERTFNKALELEPQHSYALVFLGRTLCDLGRFGEALTVFDKALDIPLSDLELGMLDEAKLKAEEILKQVSELGVSPCLPSEEMGVQLYNLGNQLVISGDLENGVKSYELAANCRIDYKSPEVRIGETIASHIERMPKNKYLSCHWLEGGIHFHDDRLTFCCTAHSKNKGWTEIGQFNGGKLPIDLVLAKRALIATQLQCGEDNACAGCPSLKIQEWPKTNYQFGYLIFNNFSVCNFRCSYCSLTHQNFEMPAYYFSAEQAVNDILDNDWLDSNGTTTWGGGDPSVSRDFRPLLNKLVDRGSFNIINTNAAIYIPGIEKALAENKACVVVSIDAGTHETFDKMKFATRPDPSIPAMVKGKKAMDAVWEVVEKYLNASQDSVILKYIVDHDNAKPEEVKSFIENCIKHGGKKLLITPEAEFIRQIPITKAILPPHIFETIRYATELAMNAGMECLFDDTVYRKEVFLTKKEDKKSETLIAKVV